jgi:hypothetical protein
MLYRARLFVVGVIGIVAIMMLIWAGLRFAAMFDRGPEGGAPVQSGPNAHLDQSGDRTLPAIGAGIAGA